jgi:hypothetical protein
MNEDTQKLIGTILPPTARRDAIHVAVAPCVAVDALAPGDLVDANGQFVNRVKAVGIVDPFLTAPVKRGQRFFIFLFPGTVTGMRHAWQHPAFDTTRKEGT